MRADIKTKWVAALRSGEYEQTEGVLRNGNGYCCLGVLCDLYSKETGMKWWDGGSKYAMHGNDTMLPHEVRVWAHLADEFGAYVEVETDEGGATHPPYLANPSLTELNDRWNYDFKQIADVIEQQL
jgi:uncharacterized protein (UPF0128 family)